MGSEKREFGLTRQEVAATLLDSGAVNFEAIGSVLAQHGADIARHGLADDPGDAFCGVNRVFVHLYKVGGPVNVVNDLGALSQVSSELRK